MSKKKNTESVNKNKEEGFVPSNEAVPFEEDINPFDDFVDPFGDEVIPVEFTECEEEEEDYLDLLDEYTIRKTRQWLKETSFKEFRDAICEEVRGQEEVEDVLLCIHNYLECIVNKRKHNNHTLIAAPSGCGKSATFHAVRKYFARKIPTLIIHRCDISNITETGYRGSDPASIIEPLFKSEKRDGIGIIFMDEFDKKLIPSMDSNGIDNNLAVQNQILTMVEGCDVYGTGKGTPSGQCVNTEKTLFIGMGSFDSIRKSRKEKSEQEKKTIGFGSEEKGAYSHFQPITREDILRIGSTNELMGRFPVLINFHPLPDKIILEVINIQKDKVAENFGVDIVISKELQEEMLKEANGPFGCREFYNTIFTTTLKGQKYLMLHDKKPKDYRIILKPDNQYSIKRIHKTSRKESDSENESE